MNTRSNQNQSSSVAVSQTPSPRKARKSTGTRKIIPVDNGTSDDSSSTDSRTPPRKARKSTGTRQTPPVDDSASDDSTSTNQPTTTTLPRKARKSTGTRQITPVTDNSPVDSTSGTTNSQTPPRKARKSTATCQIAPADSSTSIKYPTRSSDLNSSVNMPSPSSSADPSQPGCSWQGTQRNNTLPNKRNTKATNSYSSSQNNTDQDISVANLDNLVNKCVSFVLVADQKKYAIKKQDIIKNVFEHQDSKSYKTVIDKACNILKKTFGLEILNIKNRKSEYLLINIIDRELGTREFAEYSSEELQKQGLVFYLLTLIYMNENVIGEAELWKALEPLGIDVNSRVPHIIFGNVKKYITVELVKQMYLEYRCICKDPLQYEFVWGERAKQEVGKEDLLEFACKVMGGNTTPQDWVYQYNDAVSKDPADE